MANTEQLALLRQGVKVWNDWRRQNEDVELDLREAKLCGTDLHGADLRGVRLVGADLSGADLRGVHLDGAGLRGADLVGAHLVGAHLSGADLRGANFRGVHLDGAGLRGTNLAGAHLVGAHLVGAGLVGADLQRADFRRAHLVGADFREADLYCAHMAGADLRRADFRRAHLVGAGLVGADLGEADLREADLLETVFGNTNLRDVRGLDTCRHSGPSTVDHRTLTKSGPLPLPFLRGCGLPDKLIDYLPSLLNEAIQFYSCFISYSTKDQAFAERLHADLQNKGVRCWFAPHDIQGGKKLHEQIDEAIRLYDRLLLILSEHSMNSEWFRTEIAKARKRELREHRRMLFPVRLVGFETLRDWECFDADTGKDSAREVREYFIPDFSDWKNHDCYQKAFERLLQDLKAEENSRT